MPRQPLTTVENNFVAGLKTEYTGLNFPENSVIETDNCVFNRIGEVSRRLGIDLEGLGSYTTIDRTGSAINSFVWLNAAGDGTTNLLVVQIGGVLRFYEASDPSTALSGQLLASSITLSTFLAAGTTASPIIDECQFATGNGFLFVFHPHLEPFYVTYDPIPQTVVGAAIPIRIRDFEGIIENIPDNQHPTSLTIQHRYNLGNQGWKSGYVLSSTTSNSIPAAGPVDLTFTVNITSAATPILPGEAVRVNSNTGAFFTGFVKTYSGTTMVITVTSTQAADGPFTAWEINSSPDNIKTWFTAFGFYPSNTEIWWQYKSANNIFLDPTATAVAIYNNVAQTTTPAPKGHYIVNPFNVDRSTISGIPGLTVISSGGERPATGAFFAGRLFYAGTHTSALHNNIYFSQIIESTAEFGKCYQENDPSAEDFFDLLPTDGGVISIQGAGQILKLYASRAAIVVFATNGVWMITGTGGNEGLGFSASDYSVNKISDIKTFSATSFVEVQGTISWWTVEGIYALTLSVDGAKIDSMTNTTIAKFYGDIPNTSKLSVRGVYDPITFIVQWVYRSTEATTIEEKYTYDKILCFNTLTQAFYVWTVASSPIKINGITVVQSLGGGITTNNVVNGVDNVVSGGIQVVVSSLTQNVAPVFKYIISKPTGATYQFSFGEAYQPVYHDWVSIDNVGLNYVSDFTTGYAVHGEAQKFFSLQYIDIYANTDNAISNTGYTIQGLWDFAGSGGSGKFSSIQRADIPVGNFNVTRKRYRIRGKGMALQLKFSSTENLPFFIIGWSKLEMKNPTP